MRKISLALLPIVILVSSCANKPPVLQPLPVQTYAQMPEVPKGTSLNTKLTILRIDTDKTELIENVTSKHNFFVKDNAKVVISIPIDQQKKEQARAQSKELRNRYSSHSTNSAGAAIAKQDAQDLTNTVAASRTLDQNTFSTAEYFNKAEQEIEKSLLSMNFSVVDRSKFEAILRDRRGAVSEQNDSKARQSAMSEVQEMLDAKRITTKESIVKIKEIENTYDVLSSGRTAGDNELVDISELIRAAQEGQNQADYILQVNRFSISPISDSTLDVIGHEKIQKMLVEYPDLGTAMDAAGVSEITQPGYKGYLNAKLIDVHTGAIVWVGEHTVKSHNVEDIKITLNMSRQLANEKEVSDAIKLHNNKLKDKESLAKQVGITTSDQDANADTIEARLANYNDILQNLLLEGSTAPSLPAWSYRYIVNDPTISPRFPSEYDLRQEAYSSQQSEQTYNKFNTLKNKVDTHKSKIAKRVAKELMRTIPNSRSK